MKFTKIPSDAFQKLQINAGILTTDFTPSTGEVGADGQIGATTGGVTFTATPTFSDFGEDIDNCPKNMKEFKRQDMVEAKMSGTFVNADTKTAKLLCGAADIDTSDTTKVVPRTDLKDSDFTDLWLVGDYSDKNGAKNGGFIAIHMLNALSTGGFQLKTADKAKGQFAFEFTAHYSLAAQDKVPYEIYIKAGTEETA
nr:MAG TPA: major tail protein [Caudoviricetes sp.]DAR36025.1 MAG TPA: major tail protein [Caudoviricetes sp.]